MPLVDRSPVVRPAWSSRWPLGVKASVTRYLRRHIPDAQALREHPRLQFLSRHFHDPWLWHFNRRATVRGLAIGAFFAFVPVPWQMFLAAIAAVWIRFNLPVAVAMVWITNPVTLPPIAYVNYQFGAWLLGSPDWEWNFDPSLDWFLGHGADLAVPLLVGSMATAVVAGILTFFTAHLFWRWRIVSRFRRRRRLA